MVVPKRLGEILPSPGGTQHVLKAPDDKTFRVHETIAWIWEHCDGRRTVPEITKDLVELLELEGERAEAEKDNVLKTLNQLKHMGLMEF
ncbi:MAG TPA: PqqD family protein [Candidatus Altiarchaeales archaeon]|nr:PqqD family protein [Candidatus Altiarchaeales archaeon]